MLLNLHVKNLAIIDEIDVYFNEHLNILTGETGAGKSIILGSINIALGGKVKKDIIRKGAKYALVELAFQIEEIHTIEKLKELDLSIENNEILISRKIMDGRVVNKINGENVSTVMLKQIASLLIDIHGQHEHQSLLYKTKHLSILDRFAVKEVAPIKKKILMIYKDYVGVKKELEDLDLTEDQRLRELSFLEYEINEIENARLKVGEEDELEAKHKKLANANTISETLSTVYAITGEGSNSIGEEISRAIRFMSKVSDFDQSLANMQSMLEEFENNMEEYNREISDYIVNLEYDPHEYQQIDERLSLIHGLKAKYGNTIEEILAYLEKAKEKIMKYSEYGEYLEKLNNQKRELEIQLEEWSTKLSEIRKQYGKELTEKITEALMDLNFLNVDFEVSIKRMDKFSEQGFDEVEFLISTNVGEEKKPLSKVASGGELSRIMLAIKSVLADQDAIDTLIFDEIDVGVSGRTAQKVSEKLALIAKKHQILCITHLPQIAAMADSHYIIEKRSDNERTTTNISLLEEQESVNELARILGGAEITEAVIKNAYEMKELAKKSKLY